MSRLPKFGTKFCCLVHDPNSVINLTKLCHWPSAALQTDRQNILAKYFAPDVLAKYLEDYFVKCSQRIILVYISTKLPGKAPPDHYRRRLNLAWALCARSAPRQGGHGFNRALGGQGHNRGSSAARYNQRHNPDFPQPPKLIPPGRHRGGNSPRQFPGARDRRRCWPGVIRNRGVYFLGCHR